MRTLTKLSHWREVNHKGNKEERKIQKKIINNQREEISFVKKRNLNKTQVFNNRINACFSLPLSKVYHEKLMI